MDTINKAAESAHETVDKIANATNQAADALGEKGEQLKNCEQRLVEDCRSYVHENPLTALAIAAAAGFVLSRLLSGR
ncbi:DUF883 family protein [Methylicorpusculum oleiharenae]|uniref:glycine zipper domain-containing protein n=1 Tax=Methylicorpusculum oleiharenae TaxID=1338687 RepID=UPI001357DAA2|nr:DUF883 family protein [Methylicorpusculum oleiharenae]MCD2451628.1 DUF883 family protein [Methylicorpusculum oleiharenae]